VSNPSEETGSAPSTDAAALLKDPAVTGRWVIDPAGSRAEFNVKHFWGLVTVRGSLGELTGEGNIAPDGTVTGRLTIDAASLSTKNKRRDDHLRSADFFDVENHPKVVVNVTGVKPVAANSLEVEGTAEAAGHERPIEFTAHLDDASPLGATVRGDIVIDRTGFDMTWSPLGMASAMAHASVVARFVRP
jgi:polyisoprenoid-binding protein YceI